MRFSESLSLVGLLPFASCFVRLFDLNDIQGDQDYTEDNAKRPDYSGNWKNAKGTSSSDVVITSSFETANYHAIVDSAETTAILVFTSDWNLSFSSVVKSGAGSSVWAAQKYGNNAALLVADNSSAFVWQTQITTHNGSIAVSSLNFSSVSLTNAEILTSGPAAHGVWSSLDGETQAYLTTINTNGLHSAAVGIGPRGNTKLYQSLAHTTGADSSPIILAVGTEGSEKDSVSSGRVIVSQVAGEADASPIAIVDGEASIQITDSQLTGTGGLGGIVLTQGRTGSSGGQTVVVANSWLVYFGDGPLVWAGNTPSAVVTLYRTRTQVVGRTKGAQPILLAVNDSTTAEDYSTFEAPASNDQTYPTSLHAQLINSVALGDIAVGGRDSTVLWYISQNSTWYGAVQKAVDALPPPSPPSNATVSGSNATRVRAGQSARLETRRSHGADENIIDSGVLVWLHSDSTWVVTGETYLNAFIDQDETLRNVYSNGHNISYNASSPYNAWLEKRNVSLIGSGFLLAY